MKHPISRKPYLVLKKNPKSNILTLLGSFIGMQKMHSAKIGDFCRSQRTAVNMIRSISAVYRQEFKASLLKSNNYLTMIVDGSSGT